jgi:hypothetical protein
MQQKRMKERIGKGAHHIKDVLGKTKNFRHIAKYVFETRRIEGYHTSQEKDT